jgi:hypothetical protein
MNYRPMKGMRKLLLPILTISLLTSCDFIKNALTYKDKTEELVEMLLTEDYEKAVDLFAMEHDMAKNTDVVVLKKGLADFRKRIVDNFGTELDYSFMKAEKKISTNEDDNTPPNTTVALVEFSNDKEFGVFKVLFDDNSGKILNINTLDVKEPIPSMAIFWLFGLLAICVPIFNIFVIRQIKKSDLRKKWLKYIAVIFLNVPAINYAAVGGLSFKLLNFQILLGISFGYMGFLNSYWSFGIPLGGLYWFWKLRTKKIEIQESSILLDQDIETKPTAE